MNGVVWWPERLRTMSKSFLRRLELPPRKALKSLCGGYVAVVLRQFAVATYKSLKLLARRFCGGVRCSPPHTPLSPRALGIAPWA